MTGIFGKDYDADGNLVGDPDDPLAPIKAAVKEAENEDLVPAAVMRAIKAMARAGMDDETMLTIRAYLAREKKHLGVGPRDLEQIVKRETITAAREALLSAIDNSSASHPPAEPAHLHTPPSWASDQDILARMVRVLRVCMGLVGEHRAAKLVYLAITSRLLGEPVNIVIKGLSSSGKSYTIECVARLFPAEAIYTMTAMSERALIYLEESLEHRTIILYEAVALREGREKAEDNQTAYIVRSLLSEGRIEYPVVIRDEETGRLRTEKLIKPGPTNLVTSTTAVSLHGENETRMISLPSNDSKAQTRAVMLESSDEKKRQAADLGEWHAFQRWIADTGTREVTIPYARCVAAEIPPVAVRLRRDWNAIRSLIKAHAIIHRASRQADDHGRIVAELADYAAVRSLVNELIAEAVGSTVPESVRKTVELVQAQTVKADPKDEPPDPDGVKVAKVAGMLKLERSAASRRLKTAADRGYLVNAEDKRGKPARYILGDTLPDEIAVLPSVHTICTPPCTHTPQDETAGQVCDCTGVCRCANAADPRQAEDIDTDHGEDETL